MPLPHVLTQLVIVKSYLKDVSYWQMYCGGILSLKVRSEEFVFICLFLQQGEELSCKTVTK